MKREGVAGLSLLECARGIAAVEAERCTLDEYLDNGVSSDVRRICGHLLFTYFRRKRALDARMRAFFRRAPRAEISALVKAALVRLFFQDAAPREVTVSVAVELAKKYGAGDFVNAVLRRALRENEAFPDDPEHVLPPDVFRVWKKRFSAEELQQLTALFLSEAPFSFRSETALPEVPGARELPGFGGFSFFAADPKKTLKSAAFSEGRIYVQDPAASFSVSLVDLSGVKCVADLCSAPGGKALLLAEKLPRTTEFFLFDASEKRQRLTRENFARRRRQAEIRVCRAQDVGGQYDLVVADVPCSNTGVFRRRPDALWRFSEKKRDELVSLQKEILFHAATLVAPGGQLLYSTCSIEEEENALPAGEFEKKFPEFSRRRGAVLLPDPTRDGAGAFVWRRKR